jgi:O-antigen/teichoic acid export membrane protein
LLKQSTPSSNSLWLLAEKAIFLIISFGVSFLLARHLQPELFGTLNFLLAAVSVLMPVIALGLNSLVSRELMHRADDTVSILGSAIGLRLLAGLLVAAVAVLATHQLLPPTEWALFSILVVASIGQGFFVIDFWLQAHSANRYGVIVRLAVLVLVSVARLIAIYFDSGVDVFVYLLCAEWLLLAFSYFQVYRRYGGAFTKLAPTWPEAAHLLRQSRWLWFTAIAAIIVLKIDQLMLAHLINDQAVGIYAAAARLSEVWYLLPVALMTGYFPQLLAAKQAGPEDYNRTLQQLCDFLLCAGFAAAVFITLTADYLVPLLYGQAYIESVEVLVIHVWAGVFFFTSALVSRWLLIEDALIAAFYVQAVGAVANVGLNFWLIPKYGVVGAAIATLLSAFVSGYIVLLFHPRMYPMGKIISWSFCLPLRLVYRFFTDSKQWLSK